MKTSCSLFFLLFLVCEMVANPIDEKAHSIDKDVPRIEGVYSAVVKEGGRKKLMKIYIHPYKFDYHATAVESRNPIRSKVRTYLSSRHVLREVVCRIEKYRDRKGKKLERKYEAVGNFYKTENSVQLSFVEAISHLLEQNKRLRTSFYRVQMTIDLSSSNKLTLKGGPFRNNYSLTYTSQQVPIDDFFPFFDFILKDKTDYEKWEARDAKSSLDLKPGLEIGSNAKLRLITEDFLHPQEVLHAYMVGKRNRTAPRYSRNPITAFHQRSQDIVHSLQYFFVSRSFLLLPGVKTVYVYPNRRSNHAHYIITIDKREDPNTFHYSLVLTEHGESQLDEIFRKQAQKKLSEVDKTDQFISLAISVLLFEKARQAGVEVKSDVIKILGKYGRDESIKEILLLYYPSLRKADLKFFTFCISRAIAGNLTIKEALKTTARSKVREFIVGEAKEAYAQQSSDLESDFSNNRHFDLFLNIMTDLVLEKSRLFNW